MTANKLFRSLLGSLLFFLFLSISGFSQSKPSHILTLKNGSIIKCRIVDLVIDDFVKIETNDGSIFVFKYSEISEIKINKDDDLDGSVNNPRSVNPYTTHKKISRNGLLYSWGATAIASAAMGDIFVSTTAIPTIGPFITISRIENDPSATYLGGGPGLLMTSGLVQTGFAIYYLISAVGESNYEPESKLAIYPNAKNLGIQVVY